MGYDEDQSNMRAATEYFLIGAILAGTTAGCDALNDLSGDLLLKEDYFPFVDGASWVYNVTGDGDPYQATMSLASVTGEVGDETGDFIVWYRIPASQVGTGSETVITPSKLASRSTGIQLTKTAIQFAEQAPLLKFPVKVGDSWSANATSDVGVFEAVQDPKIYVLGTQKFEVVQTDGAIKNSACVRVDLKTLGLTEAGLADNTKPRSPILKRWYAPGVGLARQILTIPPASEDAEVTTVTWDLTSVTIPKPAAEGPIE